MHRSSPAEERPAGDQGWCGEVSDLCGWCACLQGVMCSWGWTCTLSSAASLPHVALCPAHLSLTRTICCSENFHFGGRRKKVAFKNRTFKVDIYGLVKNTLLMPTHTWSLSLLGPIQLPRSTGSPGPSAETSPKHIWAVPENAKLTLSWELSSPWQPPTLVLRATAQPVSPPHQAARVLALARLSFLFFFNFLNR